MEREQYNLTVLTRILTNPETGDYLLFQTFVNIAPRPDKAEPVADVVNMVNKTTLSNEWLGYVIIVVVVLIIFYPFIEEFIRGLKEAIERVKRRVEEEEESKPW